MKTFFINLLILTGLLCCVEIFYKINFPDYFYYERSCRESFSKKAIHSLDTNWVQLDNDLGWVCQQKSKLKFYLSEFSDIPYQINAEGFRNTKSIQDLTVSKKKKILLLGDSFLFGIFLKEESTISAQLKSKLGEEYEIINLAIPGWGIDQMFQAYQKYISELNPDQVILVFIDEDVHRTIEAFYWGASTKQSYQLKNGNLMLRPNTHGKLNKVECWFVFNFQIVNRLYHYYCKKEAENLSKVIIHQLQKKEIKSNRKLKVVRLPRIEQLQNRIKPSLDLSDYFNQEKIEFFDLEHQLKSVPIKELKSFYLPNDSHLSEQGAEFVASELFKIIK